MLEKDKPGAVAILGYGRFGASLASLLSDASIEVRAFDPVASVPSEVRAGSVEELVRGASYVVLAVPVPVMREAVLAVRPFLETRQLVLDVGSVKVKPEQAMADLLGTDNPWIATHPLFGPTSLALAERPLRVVVCPNATHPSAAARARHLYEYLGCQVLEQTSHAHDLAMAETHALAFFVAKGMLDAAVGLNVPYAPPSFQAIARTVDVVRSDAGHLFSAIQRENPYASQARKRLLEAMSAVDVAIDATNVDEGESSTTASPEHRPSATLAIPGLEAQSPELLETRHLIDEVDREIVGLLARRSELAKRAGRVKAELGYGVHDPAREATLFESRRHWGSEAGVDADTVEEIFRTIVRCARRLQGIDGGRR